MSPTELVEAKQYGRWQLWLDLADAALDVVYLSVFALLVAVPLDAWLAHRLPSDLLRLLALYGAMIGLHECVSFPLAWFSGYTVEHRFGLSRQSFAGWLYRHAKRFALAVVFGTVMVLALYALFWHVGAWWWLAAAVAFFLVSVVLGQLAPVLILPLFYKIEKLEHEELAARVGALARESGLSIEGVYRMVLSDETAKANAMLAGLGRTRRVLLGDTLLDRFTLDEIEVVFAHEIGHHVYRHIPKLMAVGFLYSLAGFWLCDRALAVWIGPAVYDPHTMPVYAMPMLMLVLAVFSLVLVPLQNVMSRRFERQCDRFALTRTGLRDAYVSAFRKLSKLNKDDPDPPRLAVILFHSHPPIAERIAAAG
ncbi:MAG: M48 family metallopeptidase [Planctomycetia bacterium]|nr:M48 family metallopeptidase [Planctomycetia bacterium]